MIKQLRYKKMIWVDVTDPTPEEIDKLAKQYDIHPLISGDLKTPSPRSKVDLYKETIHLVCHFPPTDFFYGNRNSDHKKPTPKDNGDDVTEIAFVIKKETVISLHKEPSPPLEELSQIFESGLNDLGSDPNGGHLLFYLLRHLYQSLESGLEHLGQELKRTNKQVFAGREKDMVIVLTDINRHLMEFRWALKNHGELLRSLELAGNRLFGQDFDYYSQVLQSEYDRTWYMLENYREAFQDTQSTNDSLLSIKNNETVKFLSVLAFIFLPISLITSIFGMSVPIPGQDSPNGLFLPLVLMTLTLIIMFIIAKVKKWL